MSEPTSSPFRFPTVGGGPLRKSAAALASGSLERILGLRQLEDVYRGAQRDTSGQPFSARVLDNLGVRIGVANDDLEKIPEIGPCVVVANHPFGGVEGLALARVLRHRRPDVKLLANYMLAAIPELQDLFLGVDPFERRGSTRASVAGLREALRWLESGGMLAVFPAGEVAHLNLRRARVEDPPWSRSIGRLIRRAGCATLPVFFDGRNSATFQALGTVHPLLRTAMLPRELLRQKGARIDLRIGTPVTSKRLALLGSDSEAITYLRGRTEILRARSRAGSGADRAVQPRSTPDRAKPIVSAVPKAELAEEIASLSDEHRLVESSEQSVFCADAARIPRILREIGRLREITFREVGEGTGREIDIDRFDRDYLHLFIWSHAENEVVGAYRLGLTDVLVREHGVKGLYTSTLFQYDPKLLGEMGTAVELGRSFVRPEYQKSFTPLLLLWKGIAQFVVRHPRYATLFGPVSISDEYQSASQRLILAFLKQNRYAHDWSRWVRARSSLHVPRARGLRLSPSCLRDLDDVSAFISEIESDGKGAPILLKQYLKLGGRLLGFNVDPEFSNVLDVLIMVQLRDTGEKTLRRYMGREGAKLFADAQRDLDSRAS